MKSVPITIMLDDDVSPEDLIGKSLYSHTCMTCFWSTPYLESREEADRLLKQHICWEGWSLTNPGISDEQREAA